MTAATLQYASYLDESGLDALPKYFVSTQATPAAPYTTITAAIAAAVADGHTASLPAVVLVEPGTYAEAVALKDGIHVVALGTAATMDLGIGAAATTEQCDVVIQGAVTLDAGFTEGGLVGIQVQPASATVPLAFGTNANAFKLRLSGCILKATGASTPCVTGSPSAAPFLVMDRCKLFNGTTQTGVAGISITTAMGGIDLLHVSIQANAASDTSISFGGATPHRSKSCTFFGGIVNVAGASAMVFEDCNLITSGQAYIAVTAGAPTVTWINGVLQGSGAITNLTGTFTFTRRGIIGSDANGLQPATTVTFTLTRGLLPPITSRDNGAANLTAANFLLADCHTLDTTASGRTVALPAANTYPPGQPTSLVVKNGANAITVTPNGTDTINGVNASMLTTASLKGCCDIMRDPNATTNWIMLSIT